MAKTEDYKLKYPELEAEIYYLESVSPNETDTKLY